MKEMKLSKVVSILLGIILLAGISAISFAAIPQTINYQGYLTDSAGDPVNGTVDMTFRIYDSADSVAVPVGSESWTETHTLVQVNQGVYSVQLGSLSTLTTLNFDVPYWLGVEVETDGEMNPRQPFDSVPFAVMSGMSEFATSAGSASSADFATSVAGGSVTDVSITGPISASKIEQGTGSTLDADTLDGQDSVDFATVSHLHGSADITQGTGSTLDADLLDGQDSAAFANTSHSHGSTDITPPLSFLSDNGITIQTTSTHINGTGIRGEGNFMGVAGYTQGVEGVGVYGLTGFTGANYGVFGYSRSPDGHGVHGMNDAGGYAGYFDGPVASTGVLTASSFSGDGASLTNLNADLLNGQHSSDIIAAAADEVRSAISACGTIISTSGSFYVTGNLSGTGLCIEVTASNVTIDLMGFTLAGDGSGSNIGIYINNVSNVEVKNGTVTNFSRGIYSFGSTANSSRIKNIQAVANTLHGIQLSMLSIVDHCTAAENTSMGINVGVGSIVTNNKVHNNNNGINAGFGSTVTNNTAYNNDTGIYTYQGSTLTNNTASYNRGYGIYTNQGSTVTNNTAYYNQRWGIYVLSGQIIGNTIASNNRDNLAGRGGLYVGANSYVKDNALSNNLQNNIYVTGVNNIIEENLVTNSINGIYFGVAGNFYANNRASDNTTNYAGTLPTGPGDGGGNVEF